MNKLLLGFGYVALLGVATSNLQAHNKTTMPIRSVLSLVQESITGTVRDSLGMPLPGVTVAAKNTSLVTRTNADGKYAINAEKGAILVFSMIGYAKQEELVSDRKIIDVLLKNDIASLNEVVVTAIGIKQQKRKLGYATQEVNTEVLAQSKTNNLGNALSGQVAGLTVNNPTGMFQSPGLTLRGKQPLIVIDGIPVETDFYDVSSEDIANINVLKGTTASALYGSRGKNGAILITTKRAQTEGLEINVGTNNMFTAGFTVFPETQTQYGNGSNGKYEFWDGADGGISDGDMIWGPKFGTGIQVPQWNSPIRDKQTGEVIEWYGNVAGTIYDDKSRYERVPIDWKYHNNLKDFLRTGIVTDNHLSIAYKGNKGQYYFSAKHAYQQGQVPNTSMHTGGLTFNANYSLSDKLQLETSLSYNKVYSPNYPRYGYGPKNHMYTILIWMGDDVNGQDLKNHLYVPGLEGYRQANYNYAWYNNPYFAAYELEQLYDKNTLNGLMRLSWQVTPDLTLQARANGRQMTTFEDMKSPKSYMNYGDSRNGDYKTWNRSQVNVDADFLATYNKRLSTQIDLTVNAGASNFYRNYRQQYQSTDGLIVPFVYSVSNSQGPIQTQYDDMGNPVEKKAIRSIYGSVNLDLFNAVYLNATARNDWSSTLPSQNRSYFYPSLSLSTILSEYIKMPQALNYLKLNGSWAQVSSDLDPYSLVSTYYKGTTYGSTPSVYYPEGLLNNLIKPEKSTSYEVGLSSAWLKNKFTLEATYYHILDENQIIDLNVSEASGFKTRKENGNQYTTKGIELVAGFKAIQRQDFNWHLGLNWTHAVKRLTDIYGGANKYNNLKVGDRADSYYATVWQKSANGELILDANTALPVRDPYARNIGHLDPNWRLGLQNTFKIKDFTINMDIDGAWGGVMNSITIEKMWWGGKHPESVTYRDQEYAAGTPVYVPNGVIVTGGSVNWDINGNVISDTRTYAKNERAVNWQTWSQNYPYQARVTEEENETFANTFDRTFFKLRRLSVGYDLTKAMKLGKIKAMDVALYGYNLFIWKKMPYLDPDFGNDSDLQDPSARYLGFSVNLKF